MLLHMRKCAFVNRYLPKRTIFATSNNIKSGPDLSTAPMTNTPNLRRNRTQTCGGRRSLRNTFGGICDKRSNCWGLFPYCNSDISCFAPLPSTMKFGRSLPNIVRRRFYCVIIVNNMVDLVLVGNFCDIVCHKTPKTVDNGIPFVII